MILTCPHCDTQFRLPVDVLGSQGHQVKCSVCEETWFQEPEEEAEDFNAPQDEHAAVMDAQGDEEDEGIDIPEGVKPVPDDVADDPGDMAIMGIEPYKHARLLGYVATGVVFVLLFAVFLLARGSVVSVMPGAYGVYNALGFSMLPPADGLVFDRVSATVNGGQIHIVGHVINLKSQEQDIPVIQATLSAEGHTESHIIPVDDPHITAEGDVKFGASYDVGDYKIQDVSLGFVLPADSPQMDGGHEVEDVVEEHNPVEHDDGAAHHDNHHDGH